MHDSIKPKFERHNLVPILCDLAGRVITLPPRYGGAGSVNDYMQSTPVRLSAASFPAEYDTWNQTERIRSEMNEQPELMVDEAPLPQTVSDDKQLIQ